MARKSVADGLRKGLQREDEALDARFAVADSAMAKLRTVIPTAELPTAPASRKPSAAKAVSRAIPKPVKSEAGGTWVRDSVSMPPEEHAAIDQLIDVLRKRGCYEVTRSQLLRAGIARLAALNPAELESALTGVERGRPGRKVN